MLDTRPDFLAQGEPARLIPACASNQRERSACSVLLAALRIVQPFARSVFGEMGRRVGNWASIHAFTEVVFANCADEDCRPDGLLILDTSRRQWKAIVEAKVGSATIKPEQLKRYCRLAKANKIDAVITISNELTPRPDHLPYELPAALSPDVKVYHWSWPYLGLLAEVLLRETDDFDDEQYFILEEVLRFLEAETHDGKGFTQMKADWPVLMQKIQVGADTLGEDADIRNAIKSWHQLQSDTCIWLSRDSQRPVTVLFSRSHRDDHQLRLADEAADFAADHLLHAHYDLPPLEQGMEVIANATARTILCQLSIAAPLDRRRPSSRINWLLGQIPSDADKHVMLHTIWDNGAKSCDPLSHVRRDPNVSRVEGAVPKTFTLARSFDAATQFAGTQNFVRAVNAATWSFYDSIARHLHPWAPSARTTAMPDGEEEAIPAAIVEVSVLQEQRVPGGVVRVFKDGSIELETAAGTRWFRDFEELERVSKAPGRPSDAGDPRVFVSLAPSPDDVDYV